MVLFLEMHGLVVLVAVVLAVAAAWSAADHL